MIGRGKGQKPKKQKRTSTTTSPGKEFQAGGADAMISRERGNDPETIVSAVKCKRKEGKPSHKYKLSMMGVSKGRELINRKEKKRRK